MLIMKIDESLQLTSTEYLEYTEMNIEQHHTHSANAHFQFSRIYCAPFCLKKWVKQIGCDSDNS